MSEKTVYIYWTQFIVGTYYYPAEIRGVFSSLKGAKRAARGDTYAHIEERIVDE